MLVVPTQANAAYIFGLTQSDIDDVSIYYGISGTAKQMMEAVMTAPFDCENFGDLCALVGETRAQYYVDDLWVLGLAHASVPTIESTMMTELEGYEQDRFDELFPSGVPTNSPWWGVSNSDYYGSCSWDDDDSGIPKKAYVEYDSGNRRLQVRAWNVATYLFNTAGGTSRTYIKSGSSWSGTSRSQTVTVNLSHADPYCGEYCSSKSASSSVVKHAAYTYMGTSLYRYVNAWASADGTSVAADNSILISDTTCL